MRRVDIIHYTDQTLIHWGSVVENSDFRFFSRAISSELWRTKPQWSHSGCATAVHLPTSVS